LEALATEIRNRLGPAPELESWPLVSIVVVNRDGATHLRRLLKGLVEHTDYPHLELILVDNGSSDESLDFIRTVEAPFPISIVANPHNESFSDANNQGAERASGELLLFLNNDIEPCEPGWLRELLACHRKTGAGAVGAILIYPDGEGDSIHGYRVQSQPAGLRENAGAITVDDHRRELFDESFGEDFESRVVIGACLLIESKLFWDIGGFTHGYFYGGEDDDLALKLRAKGFRTLYSGRSILIHHFSSTSRELHGGSGGATRRGNRLLVFRRWGPRAWREFALDLLSGRGIWAAPVQETSALPSREEVLALGFCLRVDKATDEEIAALKGLEAEVARRGHRCLALRDDSGADARAYLYDIAIYMRGAIRYTPAPGQLNVLWVVSHFDALSGIECGLYDLVATSDIELAARLRNESEATPVVELDAHRSSGSLIDAALKRAEEIDFPTRIEPSGKADPLQRIRIQL